MSASFNTEALVSAVRLRAMLPTTDDGVAFPRDTDIISLANQELVNFLVPWILVAREGHFLTATTTPLVAGQAAYTLPARAVAAEVAAVLLVDSQGNPSYPGLAESDLETAIQYPFASSFSGQPTRFYWQGNTVVLVPTPSDASLSLKLVYPQRPNQLVASTAVATVTATSQVGGNFRVSFSSGTAPTSFLTGLAYEVVHANPGFELVTLGTAGTVAATYIEFPGTLPTGINIGDSLCLADTANYPTNVPADVYTGLFADWLALRIAEIRGDEAAQKRSEEVFTRSEKWARQAYLGKRDRLGHRKISSQSSRTWGRRPLFWAR